MSSISLEAPLLISRPKRYSFAFVVGLLALAGWLKILPLFLSALFSLLLLNLLTFHGRKILAVLLYIFVITVITYGLVSFGHQAVVTLPKVAETTIPKLVAYAEQNGRELPFTDWQTLKTSVMDGIMSGTRSLTNVALIAEAATRLLVQVIVGGVVACGIFFNSRINLDRDEPDSLYGLCSQEIAARFRTFFQSFSTVMGAQIIISAINTALTGLYIAAVGLPHHLVLIGITFLCGLLPVIGNLLSNTVITAVAFTVSPQLAGWSLVYLIVIHKFEYFLNSKIVGDRIRNPVWLTLLALIIGEMLLGLPGMILAPIFLHYLKVEASQIKLPEGAGTSADEPAV
jgi:predicted PurR-regulated permease PerM